MLVTRRLDFAEMLVDRIRVRSTPNDVVAWPVRDRGLEDSEDREPIRNAPFHRPTIETGAVALACGGDLTQGSGGREGISVGAFY